MANSDEKTVGHLNCRRRRFEIRRNDESSSSQFSYQIRSINSSQNYALIPKIDESCVLESQPNEDRERRQSDISNHYSTLDFAGRMKQLSQLYDSNSFPKIIMNVLIGKIIWRCALSFINFIMPIKRFIMVGGGGVYSGLSSTFLLMANKYFLVVHYVTRSI